MPSSDWGTIEVAAKVNMCFALGKKIREKKERKKRENKRKIFTIPMDGYFLYSEKKFQMFLLVRPID